MPPQPRWPTWLTPEDLLAWRQGRVPYLESVVHTNLHKISEAMKLYRRWAAGQGLKPSETVYRRFGRGPKHPLRFSKSGNPLLERAYRTHYVSPRELPPARTTVKKRPVFNGHPDEIIGLDWSGSWSPDEPF